MGLNSWVSGGVIYWHGKDRESRFNKEGGGICPLDLEVDRQLLVNQIDQKDQEIRKARVGAE